MHVCAYFFNLYFQFYFICTFHNSILVLNVYTYQCAVVCLSYKQLTNSELRPLMLVTNIYCVRNNENLACRIANCKYEGTRLLL